MRETAMRVFIGLAMVVLCVTLVAACATAPVSQSRKEEQQAEVRAMVSRALQRFYEANPGTQQQVADEAGYAVFSDIGFKTMFLGGVKGKGMAVNNGTKQETFMKMFQLQPGLGVGIEKFCLLFIFDTPEAFNKFLTSGWELGANVMAAAKHGQKGGAFAKATTLSQDVHMTQIIEKGLIVGVSLTGAKFSRDSELKGGKA